MTFRVSKQSLRGLFHEPPGRAAFADELGALIAGKKPMVYTGMPFDYVDPPSPEYLRLLRTAFEHELVMIHVPSHGHVGIMLARREEIWRAFAFFSHQQVVHRYARWDNGAENFQSFLLGYDKPTRAAWIAGHDARRVRPGAATLHLLLTPGHRRTLRSFAMRGLTPEATEPPITAFFLGLHPGVPAPHARRHLGELTLARVAVRWQPLLALFGGRDNMRRLPVIRKLGPADVRTFNEALDSRIQIWNGKRWI